MTATSELVHHFAAPTYERLATGHIEQMKRLLLDYCGVALSGSCTDTGRIAGRFVSSIGGFPQATIIGTDVRVPAIQAAFANAIAEHSIELDDVDELALFHFGPPVVSAALATAEWHHASGKVLLTAIVAGCEMMSRLSMATNPALRDRGFHTTPTCGVFGAAVAAGRIIGLDEVEMVSALGLAGAQASGLMEMYGPSMQKRINPGPAARDGVTSAILAQMGFTGTDTILDGQRGFGVAFAAGLNTDVLLSKLGEEIPVTIEYKPYSAARPIHNAIDCALALRSQYDLQLDDIAEIIVIRHPDWSQYHTNLAPKTYHEAQVSLPYSVALALVDGSALPSQYAENHLRRPELVRLCERLSLQSDGHLPRGVSCRMRIALTDGRTFEAQIDNPKGSVSNPLTDDEIVAKFMFLAAPVIGAPRASAVARTISQVEELTDISELMASFVPNRGGRVGA